MLLVSIVFVKKNIGLTFRIIKLVLLYFYYSKETVVQH